MVVLAAMLLAPRIALVMSAMILAFGMEWVVWSAVDVQTFWLMRIIGVGIGGAALGLDARDWHRAYQDRLFDDDEDEGVVELADTRV